MDKVQTRRLAKNLRRGDEIWAGLNIAYAKVESVFHDATHAHFTLVVDTSVLTRRDLPRQFDLSIELQEEVDVLATARLRKNGKTIKYTNLK